VKNALFLSFLMTAGALSARAQEFASKETPIGHAYYDNMPVPGDKDQGDRKRQDYIKDLTEQVNANPGILFSAEFPKWYDDEMAAGAKNSIEFFAGTSSRSKDPHSLSLRLETLRTIYNADSTVFYTIKRDETYIDYDLSSTIEYYNQDTQSDHDTECVEQTAMISRYTQKRGEKPNLTDQHKLEFKKYSANPLFRFQSIHLRDGAEPQKILRVYDRYIDRSFNETREIMLKRFNYNPEAATADRFFYTVPASVQLIPRISEGVDLDSLKRQQRASKASPK
jgi:hypothetical protein